MGACGGGRIGPSAKARGCPCSPGAPPLFCSPAMSLAGAVRARSRPACPGGDVGMAFAQYVGRMAPTVKWTIAPDFVKVAAFGEATRDDIVAAIVGATRNPRFVRGMGLLVDGRALKDEGGS